MAPEGRTTLIQHLTQKGVPVGEIVEAGLAVVPEGQSEPIDFFRNRLTIPIGDTRGRIIAFGARTLLPDGKPKYINTGETPLFHKGRTLYNLDRARKPAHDAQTIIVAEGYLDVIALAKAGIENAVAPLGTALTEDQIGLLWRVAPEPILCFDGDAAGQRAAHKAIDRALPLLKPGQSLRFAFLPDGLDPDDLIKRDGAAAMEAVLKAARPLIEVFWERERDLADISTPERRAALQHRIEGAADSIADAVVRDHYKRELKDRLWGLFRPQRPVRAAGVGIPLRQLGGGPLKPSLRRPPPPRNRFSAVPPPVYGQNPPSLRNSAAAKSDARGNSSRAEKDLACLMVRYPGIVLQNYEAVEQLTFNDARLESLRIEILHFAVENHVLDESVLKDHLCGQGLAETLSGLEKRVFFALSGSASGPSPDDVLLEWRDALASYNLTTLRPEERRARGDVAREGNETSLRRLSETESAVKRQIGILLGDGDLTD